MTPPAGTHLWPLQNCIRQVQSLPKQHAKTAKAKSELYTATIGLLIHAKKDRQLLFA